MKCSVVVRVNISILIICLLGIVALCPTKAMGEIPEIPISTANDSQLLPKVAYNSNDNEFVAVWYDYRRTGEEPDIYAQRMSGSYELIGNNFTIAISSGTDIDEVYPSIAYNSTNNEYLVVWNELFGYHDRYYIYGQRVSRTGSLLGLPIVISKVDVRVRRFLPEVAYNSANNEYLVVWHGQAQEEEAYRIYGQRLLADGSWAGGNFAIGEYIDTGHSDYFQWLPAIAYNSSNNEYLVVWEDQRNATVGDARGQKDIYAQRISGQGDLLGHNFSICSVADNQETPSVAYNSADNKYLVAWHDKRNGSNADIYAQRVSGAGDLLGNEIAIRMGSETSLNPSAAYNSKSNTYFIAWEGNGDILAQAISSDGDLIGNRCDLNGDDKVDHSDQLIFATAYGSKPGDPNWNPACDFNEDDIVDDKDLAYFEKHYGISYYVICDATGTQCCPSVVYNSANNKYFITWQDSRSGDADIYGTWAAPRPDPCTPNPPVITNPAVESDSHHNCNGDMYIWTANVTDPDGDSLTVELHLLGLGDLNQNGYLDDDDIDRIVGIWEGRYPMPEDPKERRIIDIDANGTFELADVVDAINIWECNGWFVRSMGKSGDTYTKSRPLLNIGSAEDEYKWKITANDGCNQVSTETLVGPEVRINPYLVVFTPQIDCLTVTINGVYFCAARRIEWDWGDGTIESIPFPGTHEYEEGGTYTVTITAYGYDEGKTQKTVDVTLDGTPPETTCALSGEKGHYDWYRSDVLVSLTATDDISGVDYTKYRIDGGPWQTYSDSFLVEGECIKEAVIVEFYSVDKCGNSEEPHTCQSFKIDQVDPTCGIIINSGAECTASVSVTLTLSASDTCSGVEKMRFSNDAVNWSPWEWYQTSKSWTLTSGDGTKTVYVEYIDRAGNIARCSDDIILDTTPPPAPVISSPTHPEGVCSSNNDPCFEWTEPSDVCGIAGYSYKLDNNPSTIPDTASEGTSRSKCYSNVADGTWYFHVRAQDCAGNWGSTDHYGPVKIDTTSPEADFTGNPMEGCVSLTVRFTDKSTGNPTSWHWDFGDGQTSNQQNPSHTYTACGKYTVTLTVSDECDNSDTEIKEGYITVNTKPNADFVGNPTSDCVPLTVQFTDKSTGCPSDPTLGKPTSWHWDFGDGQTSTQQHPSHTYTTCGKYTVTLIVSNECGSDTETKQEYINVLPCHGDVSGDGNVTAYDASLVLQHVVGLRELSDTEREAADVTGDGTVSALDAALILQYTVSLITSFPVDSAPVAPALNPQNETKLLVEVIKLLESISLTKEQKRVLEQLKSLISKQLLPKHTALLQNYPNPFNPETWLPYQLAQDANVTISIYNIKGQLVRTLHLGNRSAGVYVQKDKAAYWDGRDNEGERVASGVYFYTLQVREAIPSIGAGDFTATRKMVIVK